MDLIVDSDAAVQKALIITRVLYESDLHAIKAPEVLGALDGDPRLKFLEKSELLENPIAKIVTECGLTSSNGP